MATSKCRLLSSSTSQVATGLLRDSRSLQNNTCFCPVVRHGSGAPSTSCQWLPAGGRHTSRAALPSVQHCWVFLLLRYPV